MPDALDDRPAVAIKTIDENMRPVRMHTGGWGEVGSKAAKLGVIGDDIDYRQELGEVMFGLLQAELDQTVQKYRLEVISGGPAEIIACFVGHIWLWR
jgi:hypothetical protein